MSSPPSEPNPEVQQLEERLRARREARGARHSGTAAPIDPYLAAAAVLIDFDPATLKPLTLDPNRQSAAASPSISLSGVSQVIIRDDQNRWALRNDARHEALRSLAATNSLLPALDANPQESTQPAQQIYANLIRGKWDYALLNSPEQLGSALQASQWLQGIVPGLPEPSELASRLSRARFLAPFEGLARDGFVGRENELQVLNDFVGLQQLTSFGEGTRSLFRGWLTQAKRGALVVHGIGGVGKSSLIARFILMQEGARLAFQRFPIVYIDFDNSSQSLTRSETLCLEAARQLTMQYPAIAPLYQQMLADYNLENAPVDEYTAPSADVEQINIAEFQQSLNFWGKWLPLLLTLIDGAIGSNPPPFLIAFDTFEEIVSRNRLAVSQIFRLVEFVQSLYPQLRAIISGRALDKSFGEDLSRAFQTLEVKEFDQPAAAAYLLKQGVPGDIAPALARQLGGSPLSLKLAAHAIRRGEKADPKSGFADLQTRSWLLFSANETVVQGQLYQRILGHIKSPELRKLAYPGLVLRRVTPDLIRFVLAAPCQLSLPAEPDAQAAAAQALFDELRSEFSLVESRGGGAVRPSNDLRRVMLNMIEGQRPAQVAAIHSAAADYYFQHGTTPEDRAEEIYHKLKRGDPAANVFSTRWIPGAGPFLEDALPELQPSVQLTLASYAGLKLPNESALIRAASLEDWERVTQRRIQEGLARNQDPAQLLAMLNERTERSALSPLYMAKAQVLLIQSKTQEAISELQLGVNSMAAAGAKQLLAAHLQALGSPLVNVGKSEDARRDLCQAVRIYQELNLPRLAFIAALQAVSTASRDDETMALLIQTLEAMPDSDWREAPQSVREAITLLGDSISPALLARALELLPLSSFSSQSDLKQLLQLILREAPGSKKLRSAVAGWLLPAKSV